jgi:hypothetical protein
LRGEQARSAPAARGPGPARPRPFRRWRVDGGSELVELGRAGVWASCETGDRPW